MTASLKHHDVLRRLLIKRNYFFYFNFCIYSRLLPGDAWFFFSFCFWENRRAKHNDVSRQFYGIFTFAKVTLSNFRSITERVTSPCWENAKQGSYALPSFPSFRTLVTSINFPRHILFAQGVRIDSSSVTLYLFPECYIHIFDRAPGSTCSRSGHPRRILSFRDTSHIPWWETGCSCINIQLLFLFVFTYIYVLSMSLDYFVKLI